MFTLYDQFLRDRVVGTWVDSLLQILDQPDFRAFAAIVIAFAIVLALGNRTIAWLRRKKIGDTGATDAAALAVTAGSKKHVPTMGGVLIIGAILATIALVGNLANFFVILACITGVWLAVLGGFDDWLKLTAASRGGGRQGLYSWEKLVFQLGIGLLVAYFAYTHAPLDRGPPLAHVLTLPFQKTYLSSQGEINPALIYLSLPVFVVLGTLMVAGMSNAVNITDGMDGLASGISAAVALGLLALAVIAGSEVNAKFLLVPYIPQSRELSVVAGAMAGACLGFLWFNCSPASVFMGDTGSLALGGMIGFIAVAVRQEIVILFMCGVFLLEIASVVLQVGYFKATGGKRIFKCAPYHHHLHLLGWTEQQVVSRLWIVGVLLVVLGLASIKLR